MAFELVGARLLVPAFGTGIEVWAVVMAVTLGALGVGYWLGGCLQVQALSHYGIKVYCVEIDPAVVRLASDRFGFKGDVKVADGRTFLLRDTRRYDAIILDAFLGGTVPEHLYTREAFEEIKNRLNDEGLLAVHLIGRRSDASSHAKPQSLAPTEKRHSHACPAGAIQSPPTTGTSLPAREGTITFA